MIIQLVTERRLLGAAEGADERRCLLRQAEQAIAAGIDMIQLREPDLAPQPMVALVRDLMSMAAGSSTRILVSERLDVAIAAEAHGVHLPGRAVAPADVRRIVPASFVVGLSVHAAAALARADGADYVLAGTVWPSRSKPEGHPTLAAEGLRAIVAQARVPVLAIGGVTAERGREVAEAGAAGIAAIGLFINSEAVDGCRAVPLADRVRALRQSFDSACHGS